ncbi:MAG: thioredoxin-disulfide reductase [Gemmatimonadales bacterium]|nr:thioredoxin-disulfide reductase [Gemmatimonadales bacterium]
MAERLIIIGSGPAAWTAALYAARANLAPVVYEGEPAEDMIPGGQLMYTTEVENFPGFPDGIDGPQLMETFKKQALRFNVRVVTKNIERVDFSRGPFKLIDSEENVVEAHAVIVGTGASANWLGLDSEQYFRKAGLGVSACAICDGAMPRFRDRDLVVVGGGDAAMEEASYLTKYASKVHVVHRRDQLRASKIMQERAFKNDKIEFVWNSVVTEVLGNDQDGVTGVRLGNRQTNEESVLNCRGMFLAIGHTPNTKFLQGQLELDEKLYIKLTDPYRTYTSVEGVFAAGDVVDSVYRQAVTAAGMGCKAAIDAERWLAEQGIE